MLMDMKTAQMLNRLTSSFYRRCARSFSDTRQAPWKGWGTLAGLVRPSIGDEALLLDIGCGNLRFERFCALEFPETSWRAWGYDSTPALHGDVSIPGNMRIETRTSDIVSGLLHDRRENLFDVPPCDLSVAFGFFHHVPESAMRSRLLRMLIDRTRPGGIVAVSLWRFMNDERIARKAEAATRRALERFPELTLESGDYLLGWKEREDVFRYCHHFDDADVELLEHAAGETARLVASFDADGAGGELNRYLVWVRR